VLYIMVIEFLTATGEVKTTKTTIDSPVFDFSGVKFARMMSSTDFIIGGMINEMPDCGVNFSGGKGTGFIAKSTSAETCIDFTSTVGSTNQIMGTSTSWNFQTESSKMPID
jgi:hypothetical protein